MHLETQYENGDHDDDNDEMENGMHACMLSFIFAVSPLFAFSLSLSLTQSHCLLKNSAAFCAKRACNDDGDARRKRRTHA